MPMGSGGSNPRIPLPDVDVAPSRPYRPQQPPARTDSLAQPSSDAHTNGLGLDLGLDNHDNGATTEVPKVNRKESVQSFESLGTDYRVRFILFISVLTLYLHFLHSQIDPPI